MRIPQGLTRNVGRNVLLAKKHSPHIFFVGGVVGIGVSTFLACKATLKLEKSLDEIDERAQKAKLAEHLTEQEKKRVVAVVYIKGAISVGRLYGPAILVGSASVAALAGSHVQLTRRNSALAGTLGLVSQAYEDYRKRVQQVIGEEKELGIYNNVEEKTETVDGKKQLVQTVGATGPYSPYARCFDESSWRWEKNAELNKLTIECQRKFLNDRLNAVGHVFLNEAYEALGMDHSQAGAVVGWLRQPETVAGDGYIDFMMYMPDNARFVNGLERNCWLDFNVDGVIYNLI